MIATSVESKLKYIPYGQARVRHYIGGHWLISYSTYVARLTAEGWLSVYGLYSATTRKHISAFVREYCPGVTYQDAKRLCLERLQLNVNTGEVRPLESTSR